MAKKKFDLTSLFQTKYSERNFQSSQRVRLYIMYLRGLNTSVYVREGRVIDCQATKIKGGLELKALKLSVGREGVVGRDGINYGAKTKGKYAGRRRQRFPHIRYYEYESIGLVETI